VRGGGELPKYRKTNMQDIMPIIISIESSGSTCGAALSMEDEIIASYSIYGKNLHDKMLAELIRRLMDDTGNNFENVDAVAVSSGPGSFTGLRIGASIAKGLCYEDMPKLIAVPTLSALAYYVKDYLHISGAKRIISAVPSHRDLLYYQFFDEKANEVSEIIHITIDEFNKIDKTDTIIFAPGLKGIEKLPYLLDNLSAEFIAKLGFKYYLEGKFTIAKDFTPLYVQDFEPKMNRKKLDF
jgi:tRNA threonylcarbamoyladenosine biosynthesis protein TsaB